MVDAAGDGCHRSAEKNRQISGLDIGREIDRRQIRASVGIEVANG